MTNGFRIYIIDIFQVAENVLDYQVDVYARAKGIDVQSITVEQRDALRDDMIREHYPGNNHNGSSDFLC